MAFGFSNTLTIIRIRLADTNNLKVEMAKKVNPTLLGSNLSIASKAQYPPNVKEKRTAWIKTKSLMVGFPNKTDNPICRQKKAADIMADWLNAFKYILILIY